MNRHAAIANALGNAFGQSRITPFVMLLVGLLIAASQPTAAQPPGYCEGFGAATTEVAVVETDGSGEEEACR